MSDRAQVAGWKAELSALFGGAREVLAYAEATKRQASGTLPTRYVLLSVMHRFGAPRNADGRTPMRGWRLILQVVGDEDEQAWTRERLDALQDRRVVALGTGLVSHESDEDRDGDLLSMWTYATNA